MTCMYPICPSVFGTSSSSLMDQRALMPIDNNTNQPGSYPSHPTFTSHSSSSSSYSSSSKLFLRSSSYPLFHIHLHLSSLFLSNSSSFSSHNRGRDGALVEAITLNRRVVGSTPALA